MKKKLLISFVISILIFAQGNATQQIRLSITDTSFLYDQTFIYFDQGLSTSFVPTQDAPKTLNVDTSIPQLYSFSLEDSALFSNGYGEFTSCTEMKLGFRVAGSNIYRFSIAPLTNFDPTTIIRLEDKTRGVFHNLLSSDYIINIDQFEHSDSRFVLHISYPPAITSSAAGCNNDDGIITINQLTCLTWTAAQLFLGTIPISSQSNVTGTFNFSGLEEGEYTLAFTFESYTTTVPVVVDGHQIQARITASTTNAVTGEAIEFSAITTNTTGFQWQFGDGTELTGMANPDYIYEEPGTYTVTLISTNSFGCSDTSTITIVITQGTAVDNIAMNDASIISAGKNLQVLLAQPGIKSLELYTVEGKKVFKSLVSDSNSNYDLSFLSNGIYIASLTENGNRHTQKLLLQD
jgi:PKD repeat protein